MTERHDDNLDADLSAYLDGELSAERAREIESLIARSDEAAGALGELRAVSDELQALPRRQAPSELMAAVTGQQEKRPPVDGVGSRRRPRVLRLFGQMAAAAAVLAACVYVSWQALDQPPSVARVEMARQPEPTQPSPTNEPAAAAEEKAVDVFVARGMRQPTDIVESAAPPEAFNSGGPARRSIVQRGRKKGAEHAGEQILSAGVAGELDDQVAVGGSLPGIPANIALDDSSAPAVKVLITPSSAEEYRAVSTVLADWQAEAVPVAEEDGCESTFYFATTDLSRRIEELDAGAPGRVRVQMSYWASDRAFLELAAGGQPDHVFQYDDAVFACAVPTDEDAVAPLERHDGKSGAPKRECRVKTAPSAPPRQPQPSRQPARKDSAIDEEDGPVDMFDREALIRRAEARHRAVTAPLPVIVVVPVATQPAADGAPTTQPTTMPTSRPAGDPMPSVPTLLSSLARLLLEGPPAPKTHEPAEAPASDGVRFQVILVPPMSGPESAGIPAGTTTQPGSP